MPVLVLLFFLVGGIHTAVFEQADIMAHIQTQRPFSVIPSTARDPQEALLALMRRRQFNAVPNTTAGADQRRILGEILALEQTAGTPQQALRGPQGASEFVGRQNANVQAINLRRTLAGEEPLQQRGGAQAPREIGSVSPVEQRIPLSGTGGGRDVEGRTRLIELRRAGAEADEQGALARQAELGARSPLEQAQDQAGVASFNARRGVQRIDEGDTPTFQPEPGPQVNAARFDDPDTAKTQAVLEADLQANGGLTPGLQIARIQADVSRERFALQEQMQQFSADRAAEARELVEGGLDLRQANQIATQNFQIRMTGLSALAKQTQDASQDTSLFRGLDPASQEVRDRFSSGLEAGPDVPVVPGVVPQAGDDALRQEALQFYREGLVPNPTEEDIQAYIDSRR